MNGVVVICASRSPTASLVRDYLGTRCVGEAAWHPPRDVSEVEQAIRAGTVQRVIFPQRSDFLVLLWDEVLAPEAWQTPGLQVEFALEAEPAPQLGEILTMWAAWRRRRRRRRATAGLILSILAVAAAFILLALARTPTLPSP